MRLIIKLEEGQKSLEEGQKSFDSRLNALTEAHTRTEIALAALAAAQKRTDQRFDRWLNSMNKGSNGKKRPN